MEKKKVVFAGSVTTRSGYGARARDIARALISSDKYDVKIIPLKWGTTPMDALNPDDPNDKMILDRIVSGNVEGQPDVFIHLTIPNEFQQVGKHNIGITAGIETTLCRPEWIDGCNKMDLVLTSSNHSKRVFEEVKYEKRDSKTREIVEILRVKRPIKVLFEGVDTSIFTKTANTKSKIYSDISEIPESFCYLFVGHWLQGELGQDRKDIGMMLKVFFDMFKQKSPKNRPALILKTSMAGFSEPERHILINKIQDVRNLMRTQGWNRSLPNVYLLHGALSDSEMNDLYNHPKVKAMVSFSHGEGYGRPLSEFTTTGKPVICSEWSGPLDFLHREYSILLPGKLEEVHPSAVNDWIVKDSKWFRVDYGIAGQLMSSVFNKYDNFLSMSRKHRKYTVDNFSIEKMQELLCGYIDNIDNYAAIKMDQGQVPLKLPQLKMASGEQKLTMPKLTKV